MDSANARQHRSTAWGCARSDAGGRPATPDGGVYIDCDTCVVRGPACADCVVTAILGSTPDGVHLDAAEQAAVDALSAVGLVAPLRLVTATDPPTAG